MLVLASQMVAMNSTSERLRAGLKIFDTFVCTPTVPTPTAVQRKYISNVLPARSPKESQIYSRHPSEQQHIMALHRTNLEVQIFKKFTASY